MSGLNHSAADHAAPPTHRPVDDMDSEGEQEHNPVPPTREELAAIAGMPLHSRLTQVWNGEKFEEMRDID